ncbi:DUF916 and DUF3324 domain-containing protein [Periweissella cryptocerci]|uniref:DUF916 and DUF3324 domain-containing protein n=1 Tax=Periweissella cryptocerci TaxID=2506420 RepID=A0A4P6YTT3_9LACO|nr:DUF916 and DUF3324 domain-containing protein [Periweissella cryptocerci]QBO36093.1 DUF916 and DUF3324 domain-containing protein [Periweissella cryptocerci]
MKRGQVVKAFKALVISLVAVVAVFVGNAVTQVQAAGLDFSVETPMPSNQIKGENSYYNLLMASGKSQTLKARLINKSSSPVKVDISAQTAITNTNGVIDYASKTTNTEKSLQYSLQEIVKVPKQVTIPANGKITVPIQIHMPTGKLKGVMAGGIMFRQVNEGATAQSKDSVAIVNQYAFTTALLIRQSEKLYQPNLVLTGINANQINLRNVISLNFVNNQPAFLNHLEINSKITKQNSDKAVYNTRVQGMQMAPNTKFAFPIRLEDKKLVAGAYTAHIVAYGMPAKDGKYRDADGQKYAAKWTFTKNFVITQDKANDLNRKSVATAHYPWWLYALVAAVVVLIVSLSIAVVLLLKRNKKN